MLCRHKPSLCSHSPLEHHRDVWSMLHGSSHWSPLCADLKNTGFHSTFTMAQGMHRPSQKRTSSTFIVKLRCSVQAIARLVGTEDEGIQKRFNSGISKRCGCDGGFILATGISPFLQSLRKAYPLRLRQRQWSQALPFPRCPQ